MLDFMRKNAQSWGVKVLFGLIVVVFVFWGVGSFRNNKNAILATVNERPIMIKEFGRAYERTLQDIRNRESSLSQEQIESMDLKNRVFNQLISSTLLSQKAREWGLTISARQLRESIGQIQVFQNEDKQFDPQRYKAVLKANRLTPGQFEQDQTHNLLMEKVRSYIQLPAKPDPEEVRDFYNYARTRATAEYIAFEWTEYQDRVEIKPERIREFYEKNKENFKVPEKIRISYLDITPSSLADPEAITDEEVARYYAEHKSDYSNPEKVKARHILIELPEDADKKAEQKARERIAEIRQKLAEGAEFADLAREYSDGPSAGQGGDLGWFSRGSMVKSFEEAAFELEPGTVSEPVSTRFGLHLIKVEDHRQAGTQTLEEVRGEIRENLARQRAADELPNVIDTALEILLETGDLKGIAEELGLRVRKTAPFSKSAGPEEVDIPEKSVNEIFSMAEGQITESPILLDQGYVLARVDEKLPSHPRDMQEVKPRIKSTLVRRAAMDIAEEEAEKALEKILSSSQSEPVGLDKKLQKTEEFGRRGFIPGLGMNPELAEELFSAETGKWLQTPFEVKSGYVLARPTQHIYPDKKEYEAQKQFWMSTYARMERQQYMQAFVQQLKKEAEIEILNPRVLEY
jgi:peptidyl-prolyl cis-trans isomerase D